MIKAPNINPLKSFSFPPILVKQTGNGIPIYVVNTHDENVFKMDICFHGGRMAELEKLTSRACAFLIREGTANYSAEEIAEKTDFYGASIISKSGMDFNTLSLYCLKRQLKFLLPIVEDILSKALMPEKELQRFIRTQKQHLKVQLSKNDVLAYREFSQDIMGKEHPYGYNSSPEYYDSLLTKDVVDFYTTVYNAGRARIYISCNWDDQTNDLLQKHLGGISGIRKIGIEKKESLNFSYSRKNIEGPQPMQTALRIGKKLFSRNHPDYCNFYILNTILGGYFGSRLMENIREDKGYSYGIYSSHDCMRYEGFFSISTECNSQYVEQCIDEIRKEMLRLRTEPVGAEELKMVQNYLLGNLMTMIDGPFNTQSVLKTLVNATDHVGIFNQLINSIINIDAPTLIETANKYLDPDNMHYVCVG